MRQRTGKCFRHTTKLERIYSGSPAPSGGDATEAFDTHGIMLRVRPSTLALAACFLLASPAAAADDLLLAMIKVEGTVGDAATAPDGGVRFHGVANLHFYIDGCRPPECESTVVEGDAEGVVFWRANEPLEPSDHYVLAARSGDIEVFLVCFLGGINSDGPGELRGHGVCTGSSSVSVISGAGPDGDAVAHYAFNLVTNEAAITVALEGLQK